ncbi:PEP/pyruvate-binding domain-containing protein [Solidesulfovibrio sp.]|uniref:PEP/pyruvate-binding domain-containing protein n=1 Tax=Solidesulfovibrio sp. TaxID=2910990 RepID=UPI002B20266F|nr:PEP/pyruvate-binding domain-containing protein [Solidesulfovibrio sp.]MEA4857611.1 PEP/pyruvate-binding domain-containing protein [Solidesulfovibrio sp.]
MTAPIIAFTGAGGLPAITEVGGKGYSLLRLSRERFPVPPGFVLTTRFFEPWARRVRRSEAWKAFLAAAPGDMATAAAALPPLAEALAFDADQARLVAEALDGLGQWRLFAVRSSSPEEDLAGASFAGGYETILGATRDTMERAVRRAFGSCLNPRVFVYKRQHGFDISQARIAVVVQAQIDADVAGVGFSLDPLTNDYDLAVFNANWGLGETVVSGLATPDQFTVDKVTGEVVETVLGAKETSYWLLPDGGTTERADDRHDEATLSPDQLREMTATLSRIEALYQCPMDIEWAWHGGRFSLLQARPITAWLPLPEEILTAPGAPRALFMDATLAIQGIQEPLSVMGQDFLAVFFRRAARRLLGDDAIVDPGHGLVRPAGGRLYSCLSFLFTMADPEGFAAFIDNMDAMVGDILREADLAPYRRLPKPAFLNHLIPRLLAHVPGLPLRNIAAALAPEHAAARYHPKVEAALAAMAAHREDGQGLADAADRLCGAFLELLVDVLATPLLVGILAKSRLRRLFAARAASDPTVADDLTHIDQALPHNITIDMGLALYGVAEAFREAGLADAASIDRCLLAGDAPPEAARAVAAWRDFQDRFGFRGPRELDLAAPRYRDAPEMLCKQVVALAALPEGGDTPRTIQQRSIERRLAAHARLERTARAMGVPAHAEYGLLYRLVEHFGGYRENHKYYLVKVIALVRERALEAGRSLARAGRLDDAREVFDLTLADLDRALGDPSLDARALGAANTAFLRRLGRVEAFPHVVDSRGRILRPKSRPAKAGELSGQGVSPGTVSGPVKVLRTPDEKPLLPGDILVARATDPGWTPLFVNAAAIVLEVGGMLQHGSLVAREYGKPCVAGVLDATRLLRDGEPVEVDGSWGRVRRLDPPPS